MADMTFLDMQTALTELLHGESGVSFFTAVERKRWLNKGYYDFAYKNNWTWRVKKAQTSLLANTASYALPTDLADTIAEVRIKYTSTGDFEPAQAIHWKEWELYENTVSESHPVYYIDEEADKITIMPTPAVAVTSGMETRYYQTVTELSADSSEPLIPQAYRMAPVYWAASKGRMKESRWDDARQFEAEYTKLLMEATANDQKRAEGQRTRMKAGEEAFVPRSDTVLWKWGR